MDDIYMNKNGFKCVRSQLAKTDGRDPQEYERQKMIHRDDPQAFAAAIKSLPIKAKEHAEDA